ncbi:hypothetical protein [Entomobacter blattae]
MTITLDCDVINADGGTRCASITGAWVALYLAFDFLLQKKPLQYHPITGQISAVSCGLDTHGPLAWLSHKVKAGYKNKLCGGLCSVFVKN